MSQFSGQNANFTPSLSQDNWVLDTGTTAQAMGKVKTFSWGANLNTATSYRTRWYRPTTIGSGTFTALMASYQGTNPAVTAPGCRFGTFATQPLLPTEPAGLWESAWNGFGGGGIVILPIGGEWLVISSNATVTVNGQIGCRNMAGVDANASSYGCTWEE